MTDPFGAGPSSAPDRGEDADPGARLADPLSVPETIAAHQADLDGSLLPSPFTPKGERPTGPAWYATPTVAYAVELGYEVRPTEAWVRRLWAGELESVFARVAGRFSRVDLRWRMRDYVRGLLAPVERKGTDGSWPSTQVTADRPASNIC